MSQQPDNQHQPFPVTPWSLVMQAADDGSTAMRDALGTLLHRYLPALRAHLLLRRRIPSDLADDLLQSFVSRKVLEQNLIARSDRTRGRFRSFLLKALDHYVIDQLREQQARGGTHAQLSAIEDFDPAEEQEPSAEFDAAWAREVIAEGVRRMRWECEKSNRSDIWGVFEARVLAPSFQGVAPTGYDKLVRDLELRSPEQASNVLMTAKRMFARALRGVLSESAENDAEIEEDLRDLKIILSQSST